MIRKLILCMAVLPVFIFAVHPVREGGDRPMMNERRDLDQLEGGYEGGGVYAPMYPGGYLAPDNQANESEWNDADVESIYKQNEL